MSANRFVKFRKNKIAPQSHSTRKLDKSDSQTTISKFFSSNTKRKDRDETETDCVVVIDDSITDTEKQILEVPLKKKAKLDAKPTDEASDSPDVRSPQHSPIIARVKHKLQSFSAVDLDSTKTADIESFDFNVLKRESATRLSDVSSLKEVEEIVTNEISQDTEEQDVEKTETLVKKKSKFSAVKIDKGKKPSRSKSSGSLTVKYTPLEQQYVEFRDKYRDAVLFIECGYKYRFFGKDAEIAAKVLKIYAHHDHNFLTASIPVHRLFVHVSRIVSAGYKVGVVQQTETAALKAAGSNKNAPFTRQLTALYTKSTMIGEDVDRTSGDVGDSTVPVSTVTSYLMCVCEHEAPKGEQKTPVGILAVQPSTGDIIYDSFDDTGPRPELETRLTHIQPAEIILPSNVSMETEKLLTGFQTVCYHGDDRMRIEKIDSSVCGFSEAFTRVSEFYRQNSTSDSSDIQTVINLPQPVICCLSALIFYLQDFKLDRILLEVSNFSQFSTKTTYMQLDSCTVRNLELFYNVTNQGEHGSLYWVINQTVTPAGARQLKRWLSKPLLSHSEIKLRQEAVSDIVEGNFPDVQKLRAVLSRLQDVERRLASTYHKKCSPSDFYSMCEALLTVHDKFQLQKEAASCHVTSKLLLEIIDEIPNFLSDVKEVVDMIDGKAAKENDKTHMFSEDAHFPEVMNCKEKITEVTKEIQEHRRSVRLTVRQPALEYCTVLGTEFLVEVKNSNISLIPKDWTKISSTKAVSRFHTPFIVEKYKLLQQYREKLVIESNNAWIQFLDSFSERYQQYRKAVYLLSTLDCLLSFATVAQQHGYVRPEIVADEVCVNIEGGRHPVIQELLNENKQYVANDTCLNTSGKHVMIITGPNMGGKSCYIRQVAVISLLAQIGSFVPAKSAKLGILDAIFTRMGAADDIYHGRSTFMVELQEAADIMAKATSRSLVILDELGRGTSTHDGVAIAHAVLNFFINQPRCMTLFVTHYPSLAEFETIYPDKVGNYHMSFLLNDENTGSDDQEQITFLYELVQGVAARSYGLNVARLANIPEHIVKVASVKSHDMENTEQLHRCILFDEYIAIGFQIKETHFPATV
ncbi:DNA mismatch repair protein Msh3-like isoform X2 [Mercenaria mercenaria]|uniref:DNA mismatch repair protein Msh3-like isoform X2 n=1 Tax=Mercenaria mercenaria TaxID=6596 RepID=UPI00234EFD7B|nr:DNA mismatch repair protein Msh3-like isoform X2 [Mercenaria mercenaria]